MPRAGGRGGKREGTPGKAYPNRSDLTQAPSAAPGQDYGQAAAQLRAQQTAPLPKQGPTPPAAAGAAAPAANPAPAGAAPGTSTVPPGGLGPLHAPSQNPNQPLTAGLNSGPGPGPEALGIQGDVDPTLYVLKGLLAKYPNADLQALLNQAQAKHG